MALLELQDLPIDPTAPHGSRPSSPRFEEAAQTIMDVEKGYVKHPRIAGGETNLGISAGAFPHADIKTMTPSRARAIYRDNYWDIIKGDMLPTKKIGTAVLDNAILSGNEEAVKNLQKIIHETPSGKMKDKTLQSLHNYVAEHGEDSLLGRLKGLRKQHFARAKARHTFMQGWLNRLEQID